MRIVRCMHVETGDQEFWAKVNDDASAMEMCEGHILGELRPTGQVLPMVGITRYLPPVDPPNVLAIGANYVDHCRESRVEPPTQPLLFIKATSSVIGHRQPIVLPRHHPDEVDYEAELAVVIGRVAKHVPEERALDYVLGYTCGHDVSARDVQLRIDLQWARGKSFDTFCPLGPWLVTELANPNDVAVRLRLNGREMQHQSTADMSFSVARLIAFLSAGMTLLPGTVIMTGTPCGVGVSREPPVFLRPGDVTEVEIAGIGILENPVVGG